MLLSQQHAQSEILYKALQKPTTAAVAAPVTAVPAATVTSLFKFTAEDDLPLERLRFDAQR